MFPSKNSVFQGFTYKGYAITNVLLHFLKSLETKALLIYATYLVIYSKGKHICKTYIIEIYKRK